MARLRPFVVAMVLAAVLHGTASAADSSKPVPPPGGHDVTKPAIMAQAAADVAAAKVGPLQPRSAVAPLRARPQAAAGAALGASPPLKKEVLGFAKADSLSDPAVGFRTWNFNLLSDVAYFGLNINPDGSLVNDSGLAIWQSGTASSFVNAAHAAGVRVLLTLEVFEDLSRDPNQTLMCQALSGNSPQTTISQARAQLQLQMADGIDIDYEGFNTIPSPCPDGVTLRTKLVQFVQQVRTANLGYLVIDTYASSAEDPGGFFDITSLAGSVDAFFVMAYGLEGPNGPCPTCMGPTSPLDGAAPNYIWNVTRAANGYAPWAAQSILGFPYYGVAGCVNGPNPPANAQLLPKPNDKYAGVPYTVFPTLPSNPNVSSFRQQRDALDPSGQELWASYYNSDPSLQCWREAYWDDQVSLVRKYDLVNQRGFRGAGMFTLDYGGGSPELWGALALEFGTAPSFESLGGVITASPAVASWGPGRLDVFVRGQDNALWQVTWNGASWSGWTGLGGVLAAAPAAVSWGPNRIDVFVRGVDNALWHRAFASGTWLGWEYLGGILTEAPAVSSWGSNRLDVFVRGTDSGLWHLAWDGVAWRGWEGLGGVLTAAPGAVSWGQNRIDVFVRGSDTALWRLAWNGTAWQGWEPRGGLLTPSAPAPASTALGLLDVFVPGLDARLWRTTWNGTSWSGFAAVGPATVWHLGPAAVSQAGSGRVDVFAVGPDNAVWHAVP